MVGSKSNFVYGEVVRNFKSQNRFSNFSEGGDEFCPFPLLWPLVDTTAACTIHAAILHLSSDDGVNSCGNHKNYRIVSNMK